MSGRPEEGLYGNVESQSSNVSQGGRRRTRSEFEGDTDYSSATRIRLEGIRRLQWTMSSTVEDILLEGTTNRANMRLNDFLRSKLGGTAAVDEDHNVTMQVFVQRPNAYAQDQQLLGRIIFNLTAYQEMKMELNERERELKILMEAVYKLHHEGVYFLRQWREYERKDTLTTLAKGKLNGVLTEIEIEESCEAVEIAKRENEKLIREAESRVRREAAERLRRTQEVKFTISPNIEEVLFKGGVRVNEMRLNDFLTREPDGRGVVATNRSVLLKEFFKDPARYIPDAEVLKGMKTTVRYLRMEGAVREEMDMEKDIRKLQYNHLSNLVG
ncbi:retrotransposon hot spot (RHS) protein [Trypanosoma cruzi Dm28c]|uniref:Retrotransposon hot spot (RHS) protein n=2 Tax=Trypanosoma cruzi TaxID=5693 RepID=V5D146_TRYCR|nr:retrotransposon hot spot (RHS) protein [Trypanosoma cruzi Dm28c]PWU86964.1 putative retrotransposon hot spot protein (RHS,) [Trypanosoma cruzi]